MTITTHERREQEGLQDASSSDLQGRLRGSLANLTVADILWVILLILACVSRLWGLGDRALHHDESLHTFYSWSYSEGEGYEHHPMMHGPFLFHINALSYILFGASDYTSRLTVAIFGIALVMLPWLLRGRALLGPWGALATSALILVSPSLLYYGRFIRHDTFALVGAFLLFIAVVRYMEKPESRWIILAVTSVAFVLTTHEITFMNLAILGSFTGALILYRVFPISLIILATAAVLFFVARFALNTIGIEPIPEIPWQEPSTGQVIEYMLSLLTHPVILSAIALGVLGLFIALWLLERRRQQDQTWLDNFLGDADEGTVAQRFLVALRDRNAWAIGALSGASLFVVLYTSLFSNMGGLGSGTFGAVGYWLGQHDVQRGGQPWFYYLVLAPQYEYLAILGALAVGIFLAIVLWRYRLDGLEKNVRIFTLTLTAFWAVTMFLVLSWAGEKMPWLIVHFMLPTVILAGGGIGMVAEWVERMPEERRAVLGRTVRRVGLPVGILLVSSFLLINWASAGPFLEVGDQIQRLNRDDIPGGWWVIYLPVILAIGITLISVFRAGAKTTLVTVGGVLGVLLLVLQINAGWSLSYRTGDIPRDMLIYVQTSPDVPETVDDLQRLSHELTGGMGLDLAFTSETQWPLNWYMREFTERRLVSEVPEDPDEAVIITSSGEISDENEGRLDDYSYIEMPLRWWIPEDRSYRAFAIAPELNTEWRQNVQTEQPPPYTGTDVLRSIWRSISSVQDPEQQGRLFRLLVHRELTAPIGDFEMRVYIHDDYRPYFEQLRYGHTDDPAL